MLVLSRKVGERIQAGSVWIIVVDIRGDKVRLGLSAPDDIDIMREEIMDRYPLPSTESAEEMPVEV